METPLCDHVRNFAVGTWIKSARGRWPPSVFACVVGSLSALAFLHLPSALVFALSLCTSLFALHLVLTPHSTFLVYFLRTSLRRMSFEMIRTWSLATERVCVRSGFPVCTCLSALAFCTPLFALHLVLTPHSAFFVCLLRTVSFEMIGFGDYAHCSGPWFGTSFFVSFFASIWE